MIDFVILPDNTFLPLSTVSDDAIFDPLNPDLLFYENGRLRKFLKNGKAYIALIDRSNTFVGFYNEEAFWKYDRKNISRNTTEAFRSQLDQYYFNYPTLLKPSEQRVLVAHKSVAIDKSPNVEDTVLWLIIFYRYIPYSVAVPLKNTLDVYTVPSSPNPTEVRIPVYSSLKPYYIFIIKKKYLGVNSQLRNLLSDEENVLADIIQVLDMVFSDDSLKTFLTTKGLLEPFTAHLNLASRHSVIPFDQIDENYHKLYTNEYFSLFRLKLIDFRHWLLNYQKDYTKIDVNDLAVYIVNLFAAEELSYLSYDFKINLLNRILKGNYWIIGNWYFNKLNEEQAIIKIILSVYHETNGVANYGEINKFLDFLSSIYDYSKSLTLYEVLYKSVDDVAIGSDDGKGNKGLLVKSIYRLWEQSKYNPLHIDSTIANHAMSYFQYTSYRADYEYDDSTIIIHTIHKEAAPLLLSYESGADQLWYKSGFTFGFEDNKIVAKSRIDEEESAREVGYYQFFQPVALRGSDFNDTIIRMPLTSNNAIKNCIPIFYLKYVDDLDDYSDFKQKIGTITDVALFFVGLEGLEGIKYIRNISLLKNIVTGLSGAERVALWEAISGLTASAQVLSSATSLIYGIATNKCAVYYGPNGTIPQAGDSTFAEYTFCQEVNNWLLALEMVSLAADLLSRRALKRATQRMLNTMPTDVEATIPLAEKEFLNELADRLKDIDSFLDDIATTHPTVHTRITAMRTADEEKAYEFALDFKGNTNALDELEATPSLIDDWALIEHLNVYKKDVKFLKSYGIIASDLNLQQHVFEGHVYSNGKSFGVHSKIAQDDGYAQIISIVAGPKNGYYEATVRVKDINGNFIMKLNKKGTAAGKSTFFPDDWIRTKIIEEMALAYTNKVFDATSVNRWVGQMSDGTECAFGIGNAVNPQKIITVFPWNVF